MREHKFKQVPVTQCRLLERNPQYLTPRQMDALKRSIERDGFVVPILVVPIGSGEEYEIISGNHRFLAARELGYENVPAVIARLNSADRKRLALNLNLIHGDPSAEQLAPFLAELGDDVLGEIHLEGALRDEVLTFDAMLADRLESMQDIAGLDHQSSKNRPDCKCPKCGRLHQSKSK